MDPTYLHPASAMDPRYLHPAAAMDPRYLHPASAAFLPQARQNGAPPYTSGRPHGAQRRIVTGSSSITDEDGVIVYDSKKAKLLRKGPSAVIVSDAATAGSHHSEHHSEHHPEPNHRQYFGSDGSSIYEPASSVFGEWYGNGLGRKPLRTQVFTPSLPSIVASPQQSRQCHIDNPKFPYQRSVTAEDKDLDDWEKIKYNMIWNGTYKSPFVPWTLDQYRDLKMQTAASKERAIFKRKEDRERDFMQADKVDGADGQFVREQRAPVQISEKLLRTHAHDDFTCVSARHTIWCKYSFESSNRDWPDPMEFMENQGRLPLPRLCELDEKYRHLAFGPNPIPLTGHAVPYAYRKVASRALDPAHYGVFESEMSNLRKQTEEIDIREVDCITIALLNDIHKDEYSAI
ncbi:hypothetical protein F5Y06DRAFT_302586 [Hypoxylon sp. FL0890]|nr:hypothetical protein F5Y06DRAFT_302586 [Hypoxylon sp. FL0890]